MTFPGRTAAAATLLTLVLAAAGCGSSDDGGDDTATFKQDYAAQSAKLNTLGADLGTAVSAADTMSDAKVLTTFDALAGRAHATVDALNALKPPAAAKAGLATLTRTLDKVAGDIDDVVTGTRAEDLPAITAAAKALVLDSPPVKAARASLDTVAKGLK